MTCISDVELLALVEGRLPDAERREADAHLDQCPSCLAAVAALARASGLHERADAPLSPLASPGPVLDDGEARYVPGEEIARGGMGRIVAARDRLFDRPVALKLLRRPGPDLVPRFLRERRVTARLQHPAIVPIHDGGALADGQPFFVMRLVSGESLDRAAEAASSMEARLRLLPAVLGAVDAVAYAHQEGVIHRDLKPQNVLVGSFGEVVVLDWGLARELDRAGGEPGPPRDAGDGAALATLDGEVLGTLAYMAPEQVEGRPVDARADVYGLGAILYHVLAGAPPHAGRSASLPAGAARHVPDPLARRAPEAPPDLVAIVERAMAPAPGERYASARELSEDLRRWQTGRLVQAHRYTTGELFGRFARKHRATLLVSAAALLVLALFGGVSVARIVAERRYAEAARARAEAQRIAAEDLVDFILGDLRDRLDRVGRLDALESAARAVLTYQDRSPPSAEAITSIRRSKAAGLAGDVAMAMGNLGAAEDAYRRCQIAAEEAASPGEDRADQARCWAEQRLGDLHKARGEMDAAVAAYDACTEIAARHEDATFRAIVVQNRVTVAQILRRRGDLGAARKILEEGREAADALAREAGPGSPAARNQIALHLDLAKTLEFVGDARAEREEAQASWALAKAFAEARPDDMDARHLRAMAGRKLGAAAERAGDLAAAEQAYRSAYTEQRALVDRDPSNTEWANSLAVASDRLATFLMARGDLAAALVLFRESDAVSVRLAALEPRNATFQSNLAESARTVGDVLAKLGRLGEARDWLRRSITLYEGLIGGAPGAEDLQHDLGVALAKLGELEIAAHDLPAAGAALGRSLEILRRRLAAEDTPKARTELVETLVQMAKAERGEAARRFMREAREVLEPLRGAASDREVARLIEEVDRGSAR